MRIAELRFDTDCRFLPPLCPALGALFGVPAGIFCQSTAGRGSSWSRKQEARETESSDTRARSYSRVFTAKHRIHTLWPRFPPSWERVMRKRYYRVDPPKKNLENHRDSDPQKRQRSIETKSVCSTVIR